MCTYWPDSSLNSIFSKVKEKWGAFSNMGNGFPIYANGRKILNTEALYQSCRFPYHPGVQREILMQKSGMASKMISKKYIEHTRPDWRDVRVDVMRFCIELKLSQHEYELGPILNDTGDTHIVEKSHNDNFWGTIWDEDHGMYIGQNVLGKLYDELRYKYREHNSSDWVSFEPDSFKFITQIDIPYFWLFGENITPVSYLQIQSLDLKPL